MEPIKLKESEMNAARELQVKRIVCDKTLEALLEAAYRTHERSLHELGQQDEIFWHTLSERYELPQAAYQIDWENGTIDQVPVAEETTD